MLKKSNKDLTRIIILSSFIVTMVCFVILVILFLSKMDLSKSSFSEDYMGNIGDFLSGSFGVLLSFVSFLLMWRTFATQREQFKIQDRLQRQASFETTYFNLLNSLDTMRVNVLSVLKEKNIRSITEWYELMIHEFETYNDDIIVQPTDLESQIEAAEGKVAEIYERFVEKGANLGFYFRYVYNSLKFAIEYWDDYVVRRKYIDLLCTRLTDEELSLIFYNALSKYGLNKEELPRFKQLLDKYQVFENINEKYLIDRSHFRFYPHTDFKFLTREERRMFLLKEVQ